MTTPRVAVGRPFKRWPAALLCLGLAAAAGLPAAVSPTASPTASPSASPTPGGGACAAPGVVLWYKASQGVTADSDGLVSQWTDLSGMGHSATAAAGSQPLLVAMGASGEPAVRFDGETAVMNVANSHFLVANQDIFTIIFRANILSASGQVLSNSLGTDGFWVGTLNGIWGLTDFEPNYFTALDAGRTHVISYVSNTVTASTYIYQDGVLIVPPSGELSVVGALDLFNSYTVGAGAGGYLQGDLMELQVYQRTLSTAERQGVENCMLGVEPTDTITQTSTCTPMVTPTATRTVTPFETATSTVTPTVTPTATPTFTISVCKPTSPYLRMWYKATQGVVLDPDGGVSRWIDLSGLGHDATATGSSRPRYVPDNGFGEPAIRFDGVGSEMNLASSSGYLTGIAPYTVIFRVHCTSPASSVLLGNNYPGQGGIFIGFSGPYYASYWTYTDDWFPNTGFQVESSMPHVMSFTVNGPGNLFIYQDGQLAAGPNIVPIGNLVQTTATLQLGGYSFYTGYFNGDIMEMQIYDGTFTDADRASMEQCLLLAQPVPTATRHVTSSASPSPSRTVTPTMSASATFSPSPSSSPSPALASLAPTAALNSPWAGLIHGSNGLVAAPNPCGARAQVYYRLSDPGAAQVTLRGLDGGLVRTFSLGERPVGDGIAVLDLEGLASGLYYLELSGGGSPGSRGWFKLAVLK